MAQVPVPVRRLDRREARIALAATVAALFALGIETYVCTIAYPGFARVGELEFPALHALHASRIAYAIGPALLVAFAANAIAASTAAGGRERALAASAAAAGAFVLAWTALVQAPRHARLGRRYDRETLVALARAEWPRALATAVQAACDVALVAGRGGR